MLRRALPSRSRTPLIASSPPAPFANVGDYHGSGVSHQRRPQQRRGRLRHSRYRQPWHQPERRGSQEAHSSGEFRGQQLHPPHRDLLQSKGWASPSMGAAIALRTTSSTMVHGMGIMFAGKQTSSLNIITSGTLNLETEDTGAVYTGGRDWLGSRGSVHPLQLLSRYPRLRPRRAGALALAAFLPGAFISTTTPAGSMSLATSWSAPIRAGIHLP